MAEGPIDVHRRTLPDQLRYHAERIYKAAADYAISDVQAHACALKILADEIEHSDGCPEGS